MRRKWIKWILVAVLLGFSAVVGFVMLSPWLANLPVRFAPEQAKFDVAYGTQEHRKLDFFYPAQRSDKPAPLIVFFYGGAWQYGHKSMVTFVAERFARRGYAVAVPDYAKFPQVKFPAFVEDGAAAIAYLHKHAAEYNIDPARIYVAGHSAGAHIGALLAADGRYLAAEGGKRSWVRAFAGLAGPYDFTPEEQVYKDIFGPPSEYSQMQVTTFIDGKQPPMLLLWGADDTVVERYNLDRLEAAIQKHGGVVEVKAYPGINHMSIIGSMSWLERDRAPVEADIDAFFRTH